MCGNSCCLGSPATQAGLLQAQVAQSRLAFNALRPPATTPLFTTAFMPVAPFNPLFQGAQFGSIVRIF